MTTEAAKKIRAKRARRPVYLMVRRLVDPTTGEEVGALVPAHPIDQRLLKERRFNVGREIRAELKQSRNPAFHRLVHAVGGLLVDHVDGFDTLTSHDAIKRIQTESGVFCEVVDVDAAPLASAFLAACEKLFGEGGRRLLATVLPQVRTVQYRVARSISFDEMDEGEFSELFRGITDYIDKHYMPGLTDAVRADYLLMAGEQRRVA